MPVCQMDIHAREASPVDTGNACLTRKTAMAMQCFTRPSVSPARATLGVAREEFVGAAGPADGLLGEAICFNSKVGVIYGGRDIQKWGIGQQIPDQKTVC